MNSTASDEALPSTFDGLIGFAGGVMRTHWLLFVVLSVFVFAAELAVWYLDPAKTSDDALRQVQVDQLTGVFADSLAVAAVAVTAVARAAGRPTTWSATLGIATDRWLAVIGATIVVQTIVVVVASLAFADPLLLLVTSPIVCVLWGVLGIAGPLAAMSGDQLGIAIVTATVRSVRFGFSPKNLGRTAYIGVLTLAPSLLVTVIATLKNAPDFGLLSYGLSAALDGLTVVPLAALQSAIVLDFIRRAEASQK